MLEQLLEFLLLFLGLAVLAVLVAFASLVALAALAALAAALALASLSEGAQRASEAPGERTQKNDIEDDTTGAETKKKPRPQYHTK